MEMHQIRYFLAAAKTLSFTRAAELCHVTQPALTAAVKKLENRLGNPLFHREGRRLVLTEFGRRMQPHLSQILERAEAAEGVARSFRLLHQVPVRLGLMRTVGPMRLAGFLAAFEKNFPGIEVAVHEGSAQDLADRLDSDELDAAILNPLDGFESYRTEPLYAERYMVLLPPEHRFAAREAVRLAELSDEPYVDRLACEMREMVMRVCADRGVRLHARFRTEREDWVQAMVGARLGFAFMPEFSVTDAGAARPLVDPAVERRICLVTLPGRKHAPAVAAFVRALKAHRWAA